MPFSFHSILSPTLFSLGDLTAHNANPPCLVYMIAPDYNWYRLPLFSYAQISITTEPAFFKTISSTFWALHLRRRREKVTNTNIKRRLKVRLQCDDVYYDKFQLIFVHSQKEFMNDWMRNAFKVYQSKISTIERV